MAIELSTVPYLFTPTPVTADVETEGPYEYDWDFGDGETSIETAPTHTYSAGSYTLYCTCYDTTNKTSITESVDLVVS